MFEPTGYWLCGNGEYTWVDTGPDITTKRERMGIKIWLAASREKYAREARESFAPVENEIVAELF